MLLILFISFLVKKLNYRLCALSDLHLLNCDIPNKQGTYIILLLFLFTIERAVVVGGGWSGLCTAQMLLKHFEEVIVLESEKTEDIFNWDRKNVKQFHHAHTIQSLGYIVCSPSLPLLPTYHFRFSHLCLKIFQIIWTLKDSFRVTFLKKK